LPPTKGETGALLQIPADEAGAFLQVRKGDEDRKVAAAAEQIVDLVLMADQEDPVAGAADPAVLPPSVKDLGDLEMLPGEQGVHPRRVGDQVVGVVEDQGAGGIPLL